jgi:hypothetical protein
LEDKRATSLEAVGVKGKTVDEVGRVFVDIMAGELQGVTGVEVVQEEDLD